MVQNYFSIQAYANTSHRFPAKNNPQPIYNLTKKVYNYNEKF